MSHPYEIPVAHIDDSASLKATTNSLHTVHGPNFGFQVKTWQGPTTLSSPADKTVYRFIMCASKSHITLNPGDSIRGQRNNTDPWAEIQAPSQEPLWPGDTVVTNAQLGDAEISGTGTYFEVTTETTKYRAPKVAFLRNLLDIPGGCAAYPNAFRREAIPPEKPDPDAPDQMGNNRVNQHTLDMRPDRAPLPSKHHHGQVHTPNGLINHTETALILPRSTYGLPLVNNTEEGHAIIYRNPVNKGTTNPITIPIRPGSIIVTPSTPNCIYGHSFTNAFAMLVAIPGFVAPYVLIED